MRWIVKRIGRMCGYNVTPWMTERERAFADVKNLFQSGTVKTIFDVGANEGQTAFACLTAFPEAVIHSFEPSATSFVKLAARGKSVDRLRLSQCALGATQGTATLQLHENSQANSLLPDSEMATRFHPLSATQNVGKESIQIQTLDAYCSAAGVEFIDLLKMDTQGYEMHVLNGGQNFLRQARVAAVLTEVLFVPVYRGQCYFDALYAKLHAAGFRFVKFYSPTYNGDGYLSYCDALFVHPEVLKRRIAGLPLQESPGGRGPEWVWTS